MYMVLGRMPSMVFTIVVHSSADVQMDAIITTGRGMLVSGAQMAFSSNSRTASPLLAPHSFLILKLDHSTPDQPQTFHISNLHYCQHVSPQFGHLHLFSPSRGLGDSRIFTIISRHGAKLRQCTAQDASLTFWSSKLNFSVSSSRVNVRSRNQSRGVDSPLSDAFPVLKLR